MKNSNMNKAVTNRPPKIIMNISIHSDTTPCFCFDLYVGFDNLENLISKIANGINLIIMKKMQTSYLYSKLKKILKWPPRTSPLLINEHLEAAKIKKPSEC